RMSAVVPYPTLFRSSDSLARQRKAEAIILAGIEREKQMWRRGVGFSVYPTFPDVNPYYGRLTVRYLWGLTVLSNARDLSRALAAALREGIAMADDVAPAMKVARVPESVASIEDAWAAASAGGRSATRAKAYVEAAIDFTKPEAVPVWRADTVSDRALLA